MGQFYCPMFEIHETWDNSIVPCSVNRAGQTIEIVPCFMSYENLLEYKLTSIFKISLNSNYKKQGYFFKLPSRRHPLKLLQGHQRSSWAPSKNDDVKYKQGNKREKIGLPAYLHGALPILYSFTTKVYYLKDRKVYNNKQTNIRKYTSAIVSGLTENGVR